MLEDIGETYVFLLHINPLTPFFFSLSKVQENLKKRKLLAELFSVIQMAAKLRKLERFGFMLATRTKTSSVRVANMNPTKKIPQIGH